MVSLYKPYMPKLPELEKILNSGQLAYGEYTKKFEQKLKHYFGVEYLIVVNSFESAIRVTLTAMEAAYGDEVIASPMACLASTQPYATAGMKIVWADIDPETGTISPDSVEKKISARTKVIVHNHFCGYPGYIDEINKIAREHGVYVIDDGIECFGSCYKDRKIGDCGTDITLFSFSPVRLPNTIDGGAVIFKDKGLYERGILIRDCGIERKKFRDQNSEINPDYDILLPGYSAMMSNVNGYIGLMQMEELENLIKIQRENACRWDQKLQDTEFRSLRSASGLPNYWVYGIWAREKEKTLLHFRDKGFYASGVHINNNRYSIFDKSVTQEESLPGVTEFFEHFLAIPCGWWLGADEWEHYQ